MRENERQFVDDAIQGIVVEFERTPHIFLTEEDVRIHLCHKLLQNFGHLEETNDGDSSIALHSEVRWYGDGDLKSRSDIVIVDVSTLNVVKHSKMPSKSYSFNIPKAIIEIKLRRPNGHNDANFISSINNDINKMEQLMPLFCDVGEHTTTAFWLVVLDKKCCLNSIPEGNDTLTVVYKYAISQKQRESV